MQKGLPVNVRDSRARAEREGWRCCGGTEEEVLRLLKGNDSRGGMEAYLRLAKGGTFSDSERKEGIKEAKGK